MMKRFPSFTSKLGQRAQAISFFQRCFLLFFLSNKANPLWAFSGSFTTATQSVLQSIPISAISNHCHSREAWQLTSFPANNGHIYDANKLSNTNFPHSFLFAISKTKDIDSIRKGILDGGITNANVNFAVSVANAPMIIIASANSRTMDPLFMDDDNPYDVVEMSVSGSSLFYFTNQTSCQVRADWINKSISDLYRQSDNNSGYLLNQKAERRGLRPLSQRRIPTARCGLSSTTLLSPNHKNTHLCLVQLF